MHMRAGSSPRHRQPRCRLRIPCPDVVKLSRGTERSVLGKLLDQTLYRRREPEVGDGAGRAPAPLARVGDGGGVIDVDVDEDRMHVELEVGEPMSDRREPDDRRGTNAEA